MTPPEIRVAVLTEMERDLSRRRDPWARMLLVSVRKKLLELILSQS